MVGNIRRCIEGYIMHAYQHAVLRGKYVSFNEVRSFIDRSLNENALNTVENMWKIRRDHESKKCVTM